MMTFGEIGGQHPRRWLWRGVCGLVSLALGAAALGCGRTEYKFEDVIVDAGPPPEFDGGTPPAARTSDKLDILFVIDNSGTTGPAQQKLAATVPYLLDRLTHPACVNGYGQTVDTPATDDAPCETGVRDFAPMQNIHIAVISSSLGGHGADICSPSAASFHPQQNDAAHLLTRDSAGGVVPSYNDLGFLVWDPQASHAPPGDNDVSALGEKLRATIEGAGIFGCGFEAPLEAFYRFLVDPDPYESVTVVNGTATLEGTDQLVLKERADFLRPDSTLLIVLLSDEDDCSTRDGGKYYLSNQGTIGTALFHLPRPRSSCASDANDVCCTSCGSPNPAGCPADPECDQGPLDSDEDPINLRCFDQKRRFGIDFLQPIERYTAGLQDDTISDRLGNPVANPLFVGTRGKTMVMLAAIVGVPWQDIARSPGDIAAGFIPATELKWARILGDSSTSTPPTDPLMIPSRLPRTGTNPVLNAPLAPPTAGLLANPINGHEHFVFNELQYACVYQLPTPIDCDANPHGCECKGNPNNGNPICQTSTGQYSSQQTFGRATPAPRTLSVLRELGPQAIVASVCTGPSADSNDPAFAYRPSVAAIMRRLRYSVPQ